MSRTGGKRRAERKHWQRLALTLVVASLIVAAFWWRPGKASQQEGPAPAQAPAAEAPGAEAGGAAPPTPPPPPSDYTKRVVAYIHESQAITRQELGEYLIARMGADKLDLLINRRIIEQACQAHRIEVRAAEVEAALTQSLQGVAGVSREQLLQQVLKSYNKTLYEWKEDVIRPKLMLGRLCQERLSCSEDELKKAFESRYGEKIECRIIIWPKEAVRDAQESYARIRDSEDAFHEEAKSQARSDLASTAGKIHPIGRHSLLDAKLEEVAFRLRPGEVSELVSTRDGVVVVKCDRRIPPDTTVTAETKREELVREVLDKKLKDEVAGLFHRLNEEAKPERLVKDFTVPAPPTQVVAVIHQQVPITREELGEFLIARYGAQKLDLLVNRHIIDRVCKEKGITVTAAEIQASFQADLKKLNVDEKTFVKELLQSRGHSLYEWKEDVVRQRLLMDRLVRSQVQVTEEDIRQAFEAYHGERIEGRIILWPQGEERSAMMEYARLRDSEEAFAWKAKHQANSKLAAVGGKIPPLGRRTTGNEELEKEAFSLQPGEVSRLIGTPQGSVVIKCDRRIPADTSVKPEDIRARLIAEIIEKKTQLEIPRTFAQLKELAAPRLLLDPLSKAEDLAASVERELKDTTRVVGPPGSGPAPSGN